MLQLAGRQQRLSINRADLRQLLLDLRDEDKLARQAAQPTFGALAQSWLERIARKRVCPDNERRCVRHMTPLLELREHQLTKAVIEDAILPLLAPKGCLGPASINRLRGVGRLIIEDAQANGLWGALNPFDFVARLDEAQPFWATLTLNEARALLAVLRPDRRRLVKTLLLVGMRPGEAFALRKVDVDLRNGMLRICRSHGRDVTKTGRARQFPIPDALLPVLDEAMRLSQSELVFPGINGQRQGRNSRLAQYLSRALGRAGIVSGYRYHCAGRGCGHSDEREARAFVYCPRCNVRPLRVSPIPRRFRFYDLRHTCASLLRDAGTDARVVQLVLGHAATNTSDGIYVHLTAEFIRRELNKLTLE